MKAALSILFTLLLLIGCKKEEVADFGYIYSCFNQTQWDSTKVTQALVGKWQLEYMAAEGARNWTNVSAQGVTVEFKADGTVQVYEKGTLTQSATWTIEEHESGYSFESDPFISILRGRMSICEDQLEFNAAIVDGNTKVFRKM